MKKLLLISMPWASVWMPSVQLSCLKNFLTGRGIEVDVRSYYVILADILGLKDYSEFSNGYFTGEAFFSAIYYPEMKKRALSLVRQATTADKQACDDVLNKMKVFFKEVMRDTRFADYEYVGFSVVFGQLFSSLVLAGKIKQVAPRAKIIFGGSTCYGERGLSLMRAYPEVDYIISHEGEYPLLQLLGNHALDSIPNLVYRDNQQIIANPASKTIITLDDFSAPDYSEYFERISRSRNLKKRKNFTGKVHIPVEISRGCWWSKCTFCSFNCGCQKYSEKSPAKIVREVKNQLKKYKINNVSFVGNNITRKSAREVFRALRLLDLNVMMEYYAGFGDFNLLKDYRDAGGKRAQFGLESLSKTLLEDKIKKGVRLIDNVQMLKWFKELNIQSDANIIGGYPNETKKEFQEAIKNFKCLYHLEPPNLTVFKLDYMSPIFKRPGSFNIKRIFPLKMYENLTPKKALKNYFWGTYGFEQTVKIENPQRLFAKELHAWAKKFVNGSSYPLLYYRLDKNKQEMRIVDRRGERRVEYTLGKIESDIYIFCHGYKHFNEICEHFHAFSPEQIKAILGCLCREHLMFKEEEYYLGLAINWELHKKYLIQDGEKKHKYAEGRAIRLSEDHEIPQSFTLAGFCQKRGEQRSGPA